MIKPINDSLFSLLDRVYLYFDKRKIRRTKNLHLIPGFKNRRGGKISYAEWAHVIGIFQTLIHQNLTNADQVDVLDIGCGTGLLGIAAEPFIRKGSYQGIDVNRTDIDFCSSHFKMDNYQFSHIDLVNPSYAQMQNQNLIPWEIKDRSKDLVTALSVWTHLREDHGRYYFQEIDRVLKVGGKAIITMFYLDDRYDDSLATRQNAQGRFHSTNQSLWVFDQKAYESDHWYTPRWTKYPEEAIGIKPAGLQKMSKDTGLKKIEYYPGNWKEQPGLYFQDILIFEKT